MQVFISHSSIDTWVARKIAEEVRQTGAATFLDEADIEIGDDFESRILQAAGISDELLVLLTPWAINRPYILLEIGVFWEQHKRIVPVLHGLTPKEFVALPDVPILLKRFNLIGLNDIGKYFVQLKSRVESSE